MNIILHFPFLFDMQLQFIPAYHYRDSMCRFKYLLNKFHNILTITRTEEKRTNICFSLCISFIFNMFAYRIVFCLFLFQHIFFFFFRKKEINVNRTIRKETNMWMKLINMSIRNPRDYIHPFFTPCFSFFS